MPHTFAIVHFVKSQEVEIVPVSWLKEGGCVWPPLKAREATKLVRKLKCPSSDWICHEAKVMGEYETYDEARSNISKAEELSDLASDKENLGKGKRKRFPKRKASSSDDDFYSNSLTFTESTGIIAPSVPEDFMVFPGGAAQEMDITLHPEAVTPDFFPAAVTGANQESKEFRNSDDSPSRQEDIFSEPAPSADNLFLNRTLKTIDEKLKLIMENQQVLFDLLQANAASPPVNMEETLGISIPISSMEEVKMMEEKLQDPKTLEILIKRVSTCGGATVDSAVKRILIKLLQNSVAENFSWLGAKGKAVFSQLKLAEIVFSAVRRNAAVADKATDEEVEKAIKNWLRHAKARNLSMLKNSQQNSSS